MAKQQRDERLLSLLILGLKFGVILLALNSCAKLVATHHHTRSLYRELQAEYALRQEDLLAVRRSFDALFQVESGEHVGYRGAGGWVAPKRQRVVWNP